MNEATDEVRLCSEFATWCLDQGLPYMAAEDLLFVVELDQLQRQWLEDFIRRFDEAMM